MKQKILVIVGPTASGKSALGVLLARKFNGEIISADSRQVYKGLNIGTGKVTEKEMMGVPHHLLDVVSPKRKFSAGDFVLRSRDAIENISSRGKVPIVVGGTGFYVDSLVGRIVLPDVPPDTKLRTSLAKKSTAQLFALLMKRDPKRARAMDNPSERNNKIRIIRALEIASSIGKSPKSTENSSLYRVLWVGVRPTDVVLKKNIQTRLAARIKSGMIREARRLRKSGLSYKRMEELGLEYRSLSRHLRGCISRKELESELQSDIWRYARKQIGYWKRNRLIKWFNPRDSKKIAALAQKWLSK